MIEIELDDMKNANMRSIKEALNLRLSSIQSLIQGSFSSFIESEVIAATTWVDPKFFGKKIVQKMGSQQLQKSWIHLQNHPILLVLINRRLVKIIHLQNQ